MQYSGSVNPWDFTTLSWFKGNALNAVGEDEDTLSRDRARLIDFINALQMPKLKEELEKVYVPITKNDKQGGGPFVQILNAVPNASVINDIKNKGERIGPEILELVKLVAENDDLWNNNKSVNENITMKYLIAELPAKVRGFLNTKLARSKYFTPPLRDIALAFLGSILTFTTRFTPEQVRQKFTTKQVRHYHYVYIGLSQDAWIALSEHGSAEYTVKRFRGIRDIFRRVLRVLDVKSLPLDFAIIYAAAMIAKYLRRKIQNNEDIRRRIMTGNYYLEILILSRQSNSQNFIAQLNTYSINENLIAIGRTRTTMLITGLAELLRHYDRFSNNNDLAKDVISLINDATARIVRFVSNNDCGEVMELAYGVKSFLTNWGNVINANTYQVLSKGLEKIRC